MANILDILTRAQALRQETALNSITPDRAGGIMYDTLILINQMQLEGGSLLISKVYSSVAAMEADTTPTSDLTGRALRPGQLAVIVPSSSSSSDMGSVYRYNEPGSWTLCGKIGGLPLDTAPIQGSTNGITSGAVYNAMSALRNEGYKYMGIATPGSGGTAPGTPNQPVFYVAAAGSYPNFGNLTVASGHLGFLKYSNASWTVESIEVGKDYDEEISQLDIVVGDGQEQNYTTGYLDATGAVQDSESHIITDYIPYSNNQQIVWYNGLSEVESVYLWAYDANKQPISEQYYKANSVPSRTLSINVQAVRFIRASMSATNPNVRVDVDGTTVWTRKEQVVGLQAEIEALGDELNEVPELIDEKLVDELGSKETLYSEGTYPSFSDGYVFYSTGADYTSTVNKKTDYIEIEGDTIETIMSVTVNPVDAGLAFYNASKSFISGVSQNTGSEAHYERRIIPVPTGTKYLRTSINKNYVSNWYLVVIKTGNYKPEADVVNYENSASGLSSNNVQGAIDELAGNRKQFTQRIPLFLGQVYQGRPLINNTTLANRNNYAYSQLIKNNGTLVSAPNGSTFACFKNDTWYIDSATIPSDCEYFRIVVSHSGNEKPFPIDVAYRNADGYLTILKETYRQGENYPTLFNWFTCDVAFPIDNPETDIEDATPLFTTAWLKLPASYSRFGKPTKMIILCHGTSGFQWDSFVETYRTPVEYFNAQGYAVLDCFPLSSLYASYSPEKIAAHSLGAACYKAAYDYAVTHFNVEKEVCIYAKSGGGISQATIVNFSGIPVKAASILCPNLDLFNDFRCMEPKSSVNRMSIFNLTPIETSGAWTSADDAVLKANQDKFSGFSPILFHSTIDAKAYNNYLLDMSYPLAGTITKAYSQNLLNDSDFSAICDNAKLFTKVPVKIWYAEDDNQVPYVTILKYQKMVQNGGGVCILRQMSDNTGGHGSADTSDLAEKITVTARDGREMTIAVGIVEALQWIELFI